MRMCSAHVRGVLFFCETSLAGLLNNFKMVTFTLSTCIDLTIHSYWQYQFSMKYCILSLTNRYRWSASWPVISGILQSWRFSCFSWRGVWNVFVVRELHLSYRERRIVGVVIKELPFSYKDMRMEGVSGKGTLWKADKNCMEGVCCKGDMHLLQWEKNGKCLFLNEFHFCYKVSQTKVWT